MSGLRRISKLICFLLVLVLVAGEDSENKSGEKASPEPEKKERIKVNFKANGTPDWGTYYDPQNVFCGEYDCYKVLGFDFESFGSTSVPSTKDITKNYRSLSREWHPDKSKHANAKEIFVNIAKAYNILTSKTKREEYDFMRYNQEAYFQKYGSSVLWQYAPKSDVTSIIIVLLIVVNAFTWFAQHSRWQRVADRLVQAAAEDWSPSQGGSPESKQLREEAQVILAEREGNAEKSDEKTSSATKKGKSKGKKVGGKEKKKQEQDALIPILKEIVNQMEDFGGGFHKPTWRDLFIVSVLQLPYHLALGLLWRAKFYIRRLQGAELNDEERQVLTQNAVGPVSWDLATDEQRAVMVTRELWKLDNLAAWKEEQEIQKLSKKEQKMIKQSMKKEKGKKTE